MGFFDNQDPSDLSRRPINEDRPIKVIVFGAGLSGILAVILFSRSIRNLELVIYENNADLGGTLFENVYPGIACDIPSHSYQFSFENNLQWSSYYASGAEIQAYLQRVATKYDAYRYMKFHHRVLRAEWDDSEGKWHVEVENGEPREIQPTSSAPATGLLNEWRWPDIPGLHDFQGKLVHSAAYDPA